MSNGARIVSDFFSRIYVFGMLGPRGPLGGAKTVPPSVRNEKCDLKVFISKCFGPEKVPNIRNTRFSRDGPPSSVA